MVEVAVDLLHREKALGHPLPPGLVGIYIKRMPVSPKVVCYDPRIVRFQFRCEWFVEWTAYGYVELFAGLRKDKGAEENICTIVRVMQMR